MDRRPAAIWLYPPRGAQVAGAEHGQECMGQGAEHQLGEAVASGIPFPQREGPRCAGATQLGQEPFHGPEQKPRTKGAEAHRVHK
jgi:hypothetical protein